MDNVFLILALVGILIFFVCIIMIFINFFKKNRIKHTLISMVVSLLFSVACFIGFGVTSQPSDSITTAKQSSNFTNKDSSLTTETKKITESETTTPETKVKETVKETEPDTKVTSPIDLFSEKFCSIGNTSKTTAEKVYDLIINQMGYTEITNVKLGSTGNINYDITADGYSIMIAVDDDGIYRAMCGNYVLYENDSIKLTKVDLENRDIGGRESDFYVIAKEIVSLNLKSPSSAVFCSLSDCQMQKNGDLVAVKGYVDAINSLGAQLRNDFLVEFRIIDLDSYSYEMVHININGDVSGEFIDLN